MAVQVVQISVHYTYNKCQKQQNIRDIRVGILLADTVRPTYILSKIATGIGES